MKNSNYNKADELFGRIFAVSLFVFFIVIIGKTAFTGFGNKSDNVFTDSVEAYTDTEYVEKTVAEYNDSLFDACREDAMTSIAYVENFFDKSYFCGARWTIGYGSTTYPDGRRVKPGETITKAEAKRCVFAHLDKHVRPFISEYVERKLTHEEMIGVIMFIYNVGGEQFSGYTADGKALECGESSFLKAINEGESSLETAKKMTLFRKSAGKRANGLLKRHWVTAALYTGRITPSELKGLSPAGFYLQDVDFYYAKENLRKKGEWSYNFASSKIREFFKENKNTGETLLAIL